MKILDEVKKRTSSWRANRRRS